MNITVYLGAHEGNDPAFKEAVVELATWISGSGNRLVYGGVRIGRGGGVGGNVMGTGGGRARPRGARVAVRREYRKRKPHC